MLNIASEVCDSQPWYGYCSHVLVVLYPCWSPSFYVAYSHFMLFVLISCCIFSFHVVHLDFMLHILIHVVDLHFMLYILYFMFYIYSSHVVCSHLVCFVLYILISCYVYFYHVVYFHFMFILTSCYIFTSCCIFYQVSFHVVYSHLMFHLLISFCFLISWSIFSFHVLHSHLLLHIFMLYILIYVLYSHFMFNIIGWCCKFTFSFLVVYPHFMLCILISPRIFSFHVVHFAAYLFWLSEGGVHISILSTGKTDKWTDCRCLCHYWIFPREIIRSSVTLIILSLQRLVVQRDLTVLQTYRLSNVQKEIALGFTEMVSLFIHIIVFLQLSLSNSVCWIICGGLKVWMAGNCHSQAETWKEAPKLFFS